MEKFAGAAYTTTCEAFVAANGRSVQACTSHSLGQNFSKVFKIQFEDENKEKQFAWQNSWGFSTRSVRSLVMLLTLQIGVTIMVHGDDKGLRLPPRAAPIQVVFVCIPKGDNMEGLLAKAQELSAELTSAGIRVEVDSRREKPGWKYNYWEVRGIFVIMAIINELGVPVRIELGERDIDGKCVMACRRDTFKKEKLAWEGLADNIKKLLDDIHTNMFSM